MLNKTLYNTLHTTAIIGIYCESHHSTIYNTHDMHGVYNQVQAKYVHSQNFELHNSGAILVQASMLM